MTVCGTFGAGDGAAAGAGAPCCICCCREPWPKRDWLLAELEVLVLELELLFPESTLLYSFHFFFSASRRAFLEWLPSALDCFALSPGVLGFDWLILTGVLAFTDEDEEAAVSYVSNTADLD